MDFKGIYPALPTPLDKNGKIIDDSLVKLVKRCEAFGVRGFYVCGSTGEAFLLSADERKHIMDVVKSAASPDAALIAQIGSLNENEAAELGKYAKAIGYDAVSSVSPFYFKYSFEEIRDYYFRLADAAELPMLVYHIPIRSGVDMNADQLSNILSRDGILGVKFTCSDFFTLERCKRQNPDKLVLNGFDEMCLCGLSMGADGAIGSTYNFMGDRFVKLYNCVKDGKLEEARGIQNEVNDIIAAMLPIGVLGATKEILNQLGIPFGDCKAPAAPLTDEQKKYVADTIMPLIAR